MHESALRPPAPAEDQQRLYLPGTAYAVQVVKRQWPAVLLVTALTAPIALALAWQQKPRLVSYAAALYDDRDSAEPVPRYPLYPRFPQVADAFKTKLTDAEFLWQVAAEVGLTGKEAPPLPAWKTWLRQHVPGATRIIAAPVPAQSSDDAVLKEANATYLRKALEPAADDKKNTLSLRVSTADALLSKQLADAAMELFIQAELRFEAESYRRQHEVFASYLHTLSLSAEAERREALDKKKDDKDRNPAQLSQDRLREQELDLVDKIQSLRAESDQDKSRSAALRAGLEADLARLTTRLQPSHPDVIAKQAEVQQLARDGVDQNLRQRIAQLRAQLAKVREDERKLGMKVVLGEGRDNDAVQQRGQFLPTLADRVKELSLDEIRISRQAEAPALRTRLRLAVPATYDSTPPGKSRRQLAVVLVGLGVLAGLLTGAARELLTPYARDLWRVAWRCRLPVLSELQLAAFKVHPTLSPHQAGTLRELARTASGRRGARAAQVLEAYRRFEYELRLHCQGQVVLLQGTAEAGQTAAFCRSFLNVVATETPGPILLIDCDSLDPIKSSGDGPTPQRSLSEFFAGKASWKEVRRSRNSERAFDLVAAPEAGAFGMAYPLPALQTLLANLTKPYARIFIRAYPTRQLLETEPLLQAASDCVLLVDARAATFAEVERAVALVPRAKARGLVMIGT